MSTSPAAWLAAARRGCVAALLAGLVALSASPAMANDVKSAEAALKAVAAGTESEQMAARAQLARALRRAGQDAKATAQWKAVLALFEKGNFSRNGSTEAQLAAEGVFWLGRGNLPARLVPAGTGKRGDRSLTEVLSAATTAQVATLIGTGAAGNARPGRFDAFQADVDRYSAPAWSLAAATVHAKAVADFADQVRDLAAPAGQTPADVAVWTELRSALVAKLEAAALSRLKPRWDTLEKSSAESSWAPAAKLELSRIAPKEFALSRLRQTEWQGEAPADPDAFGGLFLQVRVCYDQHIGSGSDEVLGDIRLAGTVLASGQVSLTEVKHTSPKVTACIRSRANSVAGLPAGAAFSVRLELAAL